MRVWQRLTFALLSIATFAAIAGIAAVPRVQAQGLFNGVCSQGGASGSVVCHTNGDNNLSGPNGIIIKVANIFAFVTGVAAVFVIMIGGFIYITASGDSGRANGGRQAVIYASIGLVVVVLGRVIIGFVITKFN